MIERVSGILATFERRAVTLPIDPSEIMEPSKRWTIILAPPKQKAVHVWD